MLVLEDDALVVEDFQRQLNAVLCDLPDSWDVLYLNAHHKVWPLHCTSHARSPIYPPPCFRTFTLHTPRPKGEPQCGAAG